MSDTFRKNYHTLKQENTNLVQSIKDKAEELEALLRQVSSREMSVAITNLETAIMWATKAVVLNDEKTYGSQAQKTGN